MNIAASDCLVVMIRSGKMEYTSSDLKSVFTALVGLRVGPIGLLEYLTLRALAPDTENEICHYATPAFLALQ